MLEDARECLSLHKDESDRCPDLQPKMIASIKAMHRNISFTWPTTPVYMQASQMNAQT